MPTKETLVCKNPAGTHNLVYLKWGEASNHPPVICVHGLTRNKHDFDKIAKHLSKDRLVICPDIAGRGESDRFETPAFYDYTQYVSDMGTLILALKTSKIDWIGTSMGGLIGMMLAAMPNSIIDRLVINDVGPYLEAKALERIINYVGKTNSFNSIAELETYLREIHAPFAPMTEEDWATMAKHSALKNENGSYELNYDPKIGDHLRTSFTGQDVDLWPLWSLITNKTLVLRGEKSDLLTKETANKMQTSGPKAKVVEIKEAGHAPSLMSEDQIELIANWLD